MTIKTEVNLDVDKWEVANQNDDLVEWIVAPEHPPASRDYPKRSYFHIPAKEGHIEQGAMTTDVKVTLAVSYKNMKQLVELMRVAETNGDLGLLNDEVIMNFTVPISHGHYASAFCTPSRNGYLTK